MDNDEVILYLMSYYVLTGTVTSPYFLLLFHV